MKDYTPYIIIISLFLWVVWDIYTYKRYGVKTTISRWVQKWAYIAPMLMILGGMLIGHFFWGMPVPCE